MRDDATHAYIAKHADCGCVVMMAVDAPRMREHLAADLAESILDGLTIERVALDQARTSRLSGCDACPKGVKHAGSALVDPPSPRKDGRRLYRVRYSHDVYVLARDRAEAEKAAPDAFRDEITEEWSRFSAPEPYVRAVRGPDDVLEDWRAASPRVAGRRPFEDDDLDDDGDQSCTEIAQAFAAAAAADAAQLRLPLGEAAR